ncbi:hypothetical protein OROMI_020050 [Orobanche minor]
MEGEGDGSYLEVYEGSYLGYNVVKDEYDLSHDPQPIKGKKTSKSLVWCSCF